VTVVYARRGGVSLVPSTTIADYPADPFELQQMSFEDISPGYSVSIPVTVGMDANGGSLLYEKSIRGAYSQFRIDPFTGIETTTDVPAFSSKVYHIDQRGFYAIKLEYHYTGPLLCHNNLGGCFTSGNYRPEDFAGSIKSNEVIFSIQ
jgi:hypothetical protein